jgi:hypothetical protein
MSLVGMNTLGVSESLIWTVWRENSSARDPLPWSSVEAVTTVEYRTCTVASTTVRVHREDTIRVASHCRAFRNSSARDPEGCVQAIDVLMLDFRTRVCPFDLDLHHR